MNFFGKYIFSMLTPSGERESTLFLRDYYDASMHGTFMSSHGGVEVAKNLKVDGDTLCFDVMAGPASINFRFKLDGPNSFAGKASITQNDGQSIETDISGKKLDITPDDDKTFKIQMKKKALILYATITKNTEKVATWFKETFEHYGMETTMIKVTNNINWSDYKGQLYFDDYDVVCMGSPIIGGSPMKCMLKHFSAGAASSLEDRVSKNAELGLEFNAGGAGGFAEGEVKSGLGAAQTPPPPPPPHMMESLWRRPGQDIMPYPGGPHKQNIYQPLGIVFTTYGGGFSGPNECLPVLELLKLYLEDKGAKVIGKFACCGKEFGPAGLDDGETPMQINEPPVYYKDANGKYHAGSFFFHCHANSKPGPREEMKARAFISDITEDHFYSADGIRRKLESEYISIS